MPSTLDNRSASSAEADTASLEALAGEVQRLRLRVELLESTIARGRRGPLDAVDRELVAVLWERIGPRVFKVAWLRSHAREDAILRAALVRADLVTGKMLGRWLRRMADVDVDGVTIRCVARSRRGAVRLWFVESESTPTSGLTL